MKNTNALWVAYRLLGIERAFEMCRRATQFVLEDLPRRYEGDAFCWGFNGSGELGNGTFTDRFVPTKVSPPQS